MEDPDSAWLSDVLSDSSPSNNGKYFQVKTTFKAPPFIRFCALQEVNQSAPGVSSCSHDRENSGI